MDVVATRLNRTSMALLLCAVFINNPNTFSQIPRLAAKGPAPDRGEKMMLFGQLVGDWEFDYVGYNPDGSKINTKGEWHFGWVLEGRAVQDVWILYASPDPQSGATSYFEYGTTVRFYDPKIDAWRVVWNGAMNGNQRTFIGRKTDDEIVMEGKDSDGSLLRWIFSEIKPQSFHWRDLGSANDGKTWRLQEEMFVRRSGRATSSVASHKIH